MISEGLGDSTPSKGTELREGLGEKLGSSGACARRLSWRSPQGLGCCEGERVVVSRRKALWALPSVTAPFAHELRAGHEVLGFAQSQSFRRLPHDPRGLETLDGRADSCVTEPKCCRGSLEPVGSGWGGRLQR